VEADSKRHLRRAIAALSWASALYLLLRVCALYLGIGGTRRHHIESAAFLFLLLLLPLVLTRGAPYDRSQAAPIAPRFLPVLVIAVLVAASLVVYWGLLFVGLFADDYVVIDAAREGRVTAWRELFRPVIFLVWRPLIALTGQPAPLLHALNIILHGVNAGLVGLLAHRLLRGPWSGLVAGAFFLWLPSGLEGIAWASGLQDVLMSTFVLLFLVFVTHEEQAWWIRALAIAALIAGLLTKETAISAPPLAAIVGAGAETREARRRTWLMAAVSLVTVAVFLAIRFAVLPLPASYGPDLSRYGLKELLVRPFATLLVPLREEELQAAPLLAVGLAAAVVVGLRVAAGRWDRYAVRFRVAVIGAAMVLAAVAPVLSYFYIDANLLGSRYLYLAQAGWVLILVAILESASEGRKAIFLPVLGVLLGAWFVAGTIHVELWTEAARARDRVLAAAGTTTPTCSSWAVYGLPATVQGVPLFINGFPEAARQELPGRIRVAPTTIDPGECRLTWNGERFVRD
jgi:hypothetical protein